MELVKKIEIITNSLELPRVLKILEKAGVSGYTIIENVTGTGDRGRVINDLATQALTNGYVMSICTEKEHQLVKAIEPVLKKFGGVCIVSDAKWIAH
ncbi:P-II family nitrogen regulator [Tolypothrix sp. VBCCA 56010]|uniref:P-II family nitrogen regulator n=1 Tax=Tolypothrix sp. VBCCA 56010 TaxID=3137731 RepID=UPI003D7E0416